MQFRDPHLQQKYEKYWIDGLTKKLRYLLIACALYVITKLVLLLFGSHDLITVKVLRLLLNVSFFVAAWLLHRKSKYSVPILCPLHVLLGGILTIYFIEDTAKITTITGSPYEFLGSDFTTMSFILVSLIECQPAQTLLVLSPIYILTNLAMLVAINSTKEEKLQMKQITSMTQRFAVIAVVMSYSTFIIALNEAELFLTT